MAQTTSGAEFEKALHEHPFWGAQAASLSVSAACRDRLNTQNNFAHSLPPGCRQVQAGSLRSPS